MPQKWPPGIGTLGAELVAERHRELSLAGRLNSTKPKVGTVRLGSQEEADFDAGALAAYRLPQDLF